MKKIFFIWFLLQLSAAIAQEQIIQVSQISKHEIDADTYLGFDSLGNNYYLKNNVFYKSNIQNLWQFKNLSLGKITRVDIQNPLKIVVFYENFNLVILLDNQLNPIQKVLFSENNTPLVITAGGLASQNKLWMYNSLTQQIGLFDYKNNTFETITPPFSGTLIYYESDYNYFQWIDEKLQWYSCDIYGKVSPFGKVPDFDQIQLLNDQSILFTKNGILYLQNVQKNTTHTVSIVEKTFEKFYYKDQILSIFTPNTITNYKLILP
jgi:hypothetical protein